MIDTADFRAYLARCEKGLLEAGKSSVRRAAVIGWEAAKETSLYKDRTGKLREKTVVEEGRDEFTAVVAARTKYAMFVDAGTRSHVITASKAPYLRFQVAGQWVRVLAVRHPGTRPRPFISQIAAKAGEQALISILSKEADAAVATH